MAMQNISNPYIILPHGYDFCYMGKSRKSNSLLSAFHNSYIIRTKELKVNFNYAEATMSYSITELSKMFNLPASTIRYYEKIGLLENVEHVNQYRRVYNDSHIDRLNAIECFKKALLPLEDIKTFFIYEKDMVTNSDKILAMMKSQEEKTIATMKDLEAGLAHLQKKVRYYSLVNEAINNNASLPSWDDV